MAKQKIDFGKHKSTLKRILNYIGIYKWLVLLSLVLAGVTVATTLYAPILIGNGVDLIVGQDQVDFAGLFVILRKVAIVICITAGAQWLMNHINNKITFQVVKDIRTKAFNHLEELPLSYLDSHQDGDIISRIIADIDQFSDGLLMGFTQLFTGVLTILGTLGFMLIVNPVITLVVVLVTPLSLFVASFIAKKTFSMFKLQSQTRGEITSLVNEMIGNEKVVQAFGYEDEAQKRFEEINSRLQKCSLRAIFFSSITNPSTRFVNSMVYASVGVVGAFAAIRGMLSVGQLSIFLSYANQYTKPFNEISGVVTELQNALACAARVLELIDEPAFKAEDADAVTLDHVDGSVTLDHVKFSYVPEVPLIEDLNLDVKPGQRIALVGPTGCGKTTIINLLMRFYDVNDGSIKVSGTDIRYATRKSLRASYGMVLQETWLKSGTIRENICYGKPDATEEEMINAAKSAHAHSFIKRMPQGYDTVISEDGGNLSQGQKQLLCIARVMLCLPPMLILDEATSSIDTMTEIRIQKAFATMMQGRTSFIVAHRLSTIREADVILVMKDGHIIEQGNHESLLARNGFYATLYNSQFAN
ncbi:ABC transporter ATP-binding protein [Brotaphodocola catenula]|uniref:ABC transporter ATP-binding protein/permease n=1 Tax=Brotaphodocola catenula TaxID=2885361 RepID=A0AAE3ASU1_9FIRM|nr:ABC transporter ATP-binding protein [Brotaphodocola catenula]MCC2165249.1 ABC transporter ATP-binding protein/permease [Brotaphodocola catenula]